MRTTTTAFALSTLLTTLHALTITYPPPGASIDPSQPITIRWTTSPSDPTTFNLVLTSPSDSTFSAYGVANNNQVATNIPTSSGSYTVPANKIAGYGTGYVISANAPGGDSLGKSGSFALGYGSSNQVVTGANGQLSLVTGAAAAATTVSGLSSIIFDTSGLSGSVTASYFPGSSVAPTVGSVTGTGTLSSLVFNTGSVTGSMTIQTSISGSGTSGSSRSGSGSSTGTSATAAATTNAQPRIAGGREVVGFAGLLAGLVALVV